MEPCSERDCQANAAGECGSCERVYCTTHFRHCSVDHCREGECCACISRCHVNKDCAIFFCDDHIDQCSRCFRTACAKHINIHRPGPSSTKICESCK
jgi:hypothetical protein